MLMRRTAANLFLSLVIGAVVGNVIGDVLRILLPSGPIKRLFLDYARLGFSPFTLDFSFVKFTFGFFFQINLMGVIFIFLMIYIFYRL